VANLIGNAQDASVTSALQELDHVSKQSLLRVSVKLDRRVLQLNNIGVDKDAFNFTSEATVVLVYVSFVDLCHFDFLQVTALLA
jgi:hypothetical protein